MSSTTDTPNKRNFMTTFRIDRENNITAFASGEQIKDSAGETETFSSRQELTALAEKWPATRLVEIWNGLPAGEAAERFTSRPGPAPRTGKAIRRPDTGDAARAP